MSAKRGIERKPRRWGVVVTAILVALGAVAAGWFVLFNHFVTVVPVALDRIAADSKPCKPFEEAKLECSYEERPDEKIPRGDLVSQSLQSGDKVRKGEKIVLTYSKGPYSFTMPELKNENIDSANSKLYAYGATVQVLETLDDTGIGKGRIVKMNVPAGQQVENGATIGVSVSSGNITVPNWVGKMRTTVEKDATNLGLSVSFIEEESDSPVGTVVSQSAEGLTDSSTPVEVKISKAKDVKQIEVPKVVGRTVGEAQIELATAGFTRIDMVSVEKDGVTEEKVVSVTPGEGEKVNSDTVITVNIEKPKK